MMPGGMLNIGSDRRPSRELRNRSVSLLLGEHSSTVARMAAAGRIPGAHRSPGGRWRFDERAVVAWVDAGCPDPREEANASS